MYHEIEGQLSIEPIIFEEEELIARGHHYPYSEIESLKITSAQLFSPYGILTLRTNGRDVPIPFPRSRQGKLERALKELERLQKNGTPAKTAAEDESRAEDRKSRESASVRDPYEEMKKLKELLDLDIITKEEFETKKKQLLDL